MKSIFTTLTFFFALCLAVALPRASAQVLIHDNAHATANFGRELEVLTCPQGSLNIETVQTVQGFQKADVPNLNLGITDNDHWVRMRVKNESANSDLFIDLKQPGLDFVEFYFPTPQGYQCTAVSDVTPLDQRILESQNYVFPLAIGQNEEKTYYFKLHSGDHLMFPAVIGTREQILSSNNARDIIFGLFAGIMIALFLYSLVIFFNTKESIYGIYVIYVFIMFLNQTNVMGYSARFLWPNHLEYERVMVYWLIPLSGIIGQVFIMKFVKMNEYARWMKWPMYVSMTIYSVAIVCGTIGEYTIAYNIIEINGSNIAVYIIAISFYMWRKGNKQAGNLLLAWSLFLIGLILFILKDLSVLPYNDFTMNTLTIGTAAQGVLLSFGLANKINQFKREKELSQERMITVMQENQMLIEEQNIRLEKMVTDRTQDLERANSDLNQTLRNLQLAQKQLLESEKLASLGQMTAGIAHEINNPINFVSSNIAPLRRDVTDILAMLDEYASTDDLEKFKDKLPDLKRKYKELDIDYLKKEIDMLLNGIEEGSRRTAEIVRGLRIFSRMDRDTLVTASVNECIASTLVVMKSMTKGEVTIEKDIAENLPTIDCYPGKLNQVFMNIISNAVQATRLPGRTAADRKISIRTYHDETNVYVRIADNGLGMSDEVRAKIFDPFFTTKPVGEGTGLGLSIALGIINEHKGSVEVLSAPDEGTEFLITLPRKVNSDSNQKAA